MDDSTTVWNKYSFNILQFAHYSQQQGEFEANFMVIVDKNQFDAAPNALTVQEALNKTAAARKIGNLKVDSESLKVGEPETSSAAGGEGGRREDPNVKLYVVVACIAALVLVAIVQASCTIFKMSRRGSSVQKVRPRTTDWSPVMATRACSTHTHLQCPVPTPTPTPNPTCTYTYT